MPEADRPAPVPALKRLELAVEDGIFKSRWLLAPIYVAMLLGLVALVVAMGRELVVLFRLLFAADMKAENVILVLLSMIDLSLVANLVLIVVFSGFESFVSKMENEAHPDRPEWMGKIDFGGLKLKLIASIAAISAIQLLKVFVQDTTLSSDRVFWLVAIHLTFVTSGVLLALMDFITSRSKGTGYEGD